METLIIKPKDKAELNFFLELTKRMGIKSATIESDADEIAMIHKMINWKKYKQNGYSMRPLKNKLHPHERLFQAMEKNKNTPEVSRDKVIDTLHRILNDES